jgi:hypothetical protein
MPIFKKGKLDLLFVHVPKTGGTSIERLFQLSDWSIAYLDLSIKGRSFNHLRVCSPQHMHAAMLKQQLLIHKFIGMFMIVRHPYDRFRSEYAYINKSNCDVSAEAVEAWARKVLKAYSNNHFVYDNHLRPQHEFFIPGISVYKLENGFNKIVQDLAVKYRIDFVDKELREMSREKESGFSSSDIELNDAVKHMLNIVYHEDFRIFGYKPEGVGDETDSVDNILEHRLLHRLKQVPFYFRRIRSLYKRQ